MNISSINSFDFDGFLKTRLLTRGVSEQTVNGVYFFDNIQVERKFRYAFKFIRHSVYIFLDMNAPSINNITMDNVVFDIGQQNIWASKHFTQPVEIFGNLTCQYINGVSISDTYRKSMGENDTIRGSLVKNSFFIFF